MPEQDPEQDPEQPAEKTVVVEAPRERFKGDWSESFVFRIGSQVVGVSQTEAKAMIDSESIRTGEPEVRFSKIERLIYRTGRMQFTQRKETSSVESFDGVLKSFETESQTGPIGIRFQGNRTKEAIRIDSVSGRDQESFQLTWDSTTRGLFALGQTLRRRPMEVGETRRLRVMLPSFRAIGLIEMRCSGEASVAMADGEFRKLREIESNTIDESDRVVDQLILWIDEQGTIQKTLRPAMRLEGFRTSESEMRRIFADRDDAEVRILVKGVLRDDAQPTTIAFMVRDSEPSADGGATAISETMFRPAVQQSIRPGQSGLHVFVSAEEPPAGFQAFESASRPADVVTTPIMDFGHQDVTRLAKVVGDLPARELSLELANIVKNILSIVPQRGVRRTSVVVRSGEGGELDHTVLLASLLRSRGIPARVAFGLRRLERSERGIGRESMRLSSWVIASIDNRWIAIDPMTAQPVGDLRMTLHLCEGKEDILSVIDQLFRKLGDVAIEIRGARYAPAEAEVP